ncbi:MAG: hypothetical protein F6K41_39225 [Symploca sp. SIO3E6]|nr:hypothetical protein [Caldora sp. SIO3E6]
MATNIENVKQKSTLKTWLTSQDNVEDIFFYDYPRRDQKDLREYLGRASEIIKLSAWETAIASAVFILEAIIPLMAEEHRIDFETKTPTEVLQIFYQKNLISLENRDTLSQGIALREAFMTKQETTQSNHDLAQRVLAIVANLFQTIANDD